MPIQNHSSQFRFCNEAQKPKHLAVKCALTIYHKLFMFTAGANHLYRGSTVSTSIKIFQPVFSEGIKRTFKGASSSLPQDFSFRLF